MKILNIFRQLFKRESNQEENCKIEVLTPIFDKRYKVIIECKSNEALEEKLNWINENSNGSIETRFSIGANAVYLGFENEDDATFFKIKYGS